MAGARELCSATTDAGELGAVQRLALGTLHAQYPWWDKHFVRPMGVVDEPLFGTIWE